LQRVSEYPLLERHRAEATRCRRRTDRRLSARPERTYMPMSGHCVLVYLCNWLDLAQRPRRLSIRSWRSYRGAPNMHPPTV